MNQYRPPRLSKDNNLVEGLRKSDLKDMIEPNFTVDQFRSKMGNDKNTIVIRFRAADKEPAIDLMEFIEKGYEFVLDADISSGEEKDGKYSIFVELERGPSAPNELKDLIGGISRLCGNEHWKFRWYKDLEVFEFNEDTFRDAVPLSPEEYEERSGDSEADEVTEFFDQGALDSITLENNGSLTFRKIYSEAFTANLIAIGPYDVLKYVLDGPIQLDESSRSQVLYLNKYLGNYDIHKIEGHFLLRKGDRAVILSKPRW